MLYITEKTQNLINLISKYCNIFIDFYYDNEIYRRNIYVNGKLISFIENKSLELLNINLDYTLTILYNGLIIGITNPLLSPICLN